MKLPIRNCLSVPLTLLIEPQCGEYQIPPGGEAIVTLQDGRTHSIDFHPDNWVSLWDEGADPIASVVVYTDQDFARV